jgi:hypothetical protein
MAASASPSARADALYIGDDSDASVKRFDADTGAPLDAEAFISGVNSPRGVVIDGDRLLVADQNANTNLHGEVLSFDVASGASLGTVVAESNKDAPFVPRGMVLGLDNDLFVGNITTANGKSHGELLQYNATSGALISRNRANGLDGFRNHDFHLRGVVIGPDDMVYAASFTSLKTGLGGAVLRFHPDGTFSDVFIADAGGFGQLNRPEGLVFGPEGNLYVTSFRAAPGDVDGVRIYDPSGAFLSQIDYYDPATEPRVTAQALLFGPDDKLFVPMTSSGEVRRYNTPTTGDYSTFIAAGTDLGAPVFLTFGETDPSTLAYGRMGAALWAESVAVPEPASTALAACACVGLLGWVRSARRR